MRKWKAAARVKHYWETFEQYPKFCWLFSIGWLLLISWLAFGWHLGSTGLVDETEPLFAEAARQMLETGDWITPYFNDETRFDKPPLIYWLMAVGYRLIGVNEWAVRLPSALAAIALVGICFYTLHTFPAQKSSLRQRWLSAWIGAAVAALNLHTIIWARTGVSDMLLSGCMGTALLCFFGGYASREGMRAKSYVYPANGWYWAFYVLLALAVLTKGPVGVVLPGIIIVPFLLYVGKLKAVFQEMGVVGGGLIFLLIAVPWFVLVIAKHGSAYTDTFFGYHNFERFTEVVNGHSAPWYYYFLIVLGLFAPWSVYLPVAIARLRFWQVSRWRQQPRSAHLGLFALFWFVAIFSFFTISVTKLPSYVLPLIPAGAILVALLWSEALTSLPRRQPQSWGLVVSGIANVLILIVLAVAFFYSPEWLGSDPAIQDESELLQNSGLPLRGGIIWLTTALIIAVLLTSRYWRRWLVLPNLIGFIALIIVVLTPLSFLVDQVRQLPLREIAAVVLQDQQPGEEIWMVDFEKPSIVFYTGGRSLRFFKTSKRLQEYLQTTDSSQYPSTALIISRPKKLKRFDLNNQDYQILADKGAYQVIRISPQKLLADS